MKFSSALISITALGQSATAVAVPDTYDAVALSLRSDFENIWKRKGGGGGGGRGGSSGGSSRGGSSSGSSGSSSSGGRNTGGSTTTGSGPRPQYGSSGGYYGGGSTSPYRAGSKTPSGLVPGLLLGSALGFWGTYWALGAYQYHYTHPYYYHNATTDKNETKPVDCLCAKDQECGCDDNGDQKYFDSVIGNGTYDGLNKTLVNVAPVNGTDTIFINGTLPNGTTASGGSEDPSSAVALVHTAGWLPVVSTMFALAYLLFEFRPPSTY